MPLASGSVATQGILDFSPTGVQRLRALHKARALQRYSLDGQEGTLQTYATLPDNAWRQLDANLVALAPRIMNIIGDLVRLGLTINTEDVGVSVGGYQALGDIDAAQLSMSMSAAGRNQRAPVDLNLMPLPFSFDDLQFDLRQLTAMQRDSALDLAHTQAIQQKVLEAFETLAVSGSTQFAYQGVPIYGMLNHPNRLTLTAPGAWTTVANIFPTILAAFKLLVGTYSTGPFGLYVSPVDWTSMFAEQGTDAFSTVIARLQRTFNDPAGPLIVSIKPSFAIPTGQAALVELAPRTVQLWVVMQPTNVPWETMGGLEVHVRTMGSMTTFWKKDGANTPVCRVVHISGI